jgi:hypothetical protein
MSDDYVIDTGKGSFPLSRLGSLLPGMAEIMPLVGERVWKCYYAGKARNQPLARFQLKEAVNLMKKGAVLRPKYTEDVDAFCDGIVASVMNAIEQRDWDEFDRLFHNMVRAANGYHGKYDKAYLVWKLPDHPPPDLDLTPLDGADQ